MNYPIIVSNNSIRCLSTYNIMGVQLITFLSLVSGRSRPVSVSSIPSQHEPPSLTPPPFIRSYKLHPFLSTLPQTHCPQHHHTRHHIPNNSSPREKPSINRDNLDCSARYSARRLEVPSRKPIDKYQPCYILAWVRGYLVFRKRDKLKIRPITLIQTCDSQNDRS